MVEYVLIGILAILTLLLLVIRSNVAVAFLALCAGSVLVSSSGDSAGLLASSLTSGMSSATNLAKVTVLLLPLVVVAFATRGLAKRSLFIFNAVVSFATSAMVLFFAYPLLPSGISRLMGSTELWSILSQYSDFVLGVGLLLSLTIIVLSHRRLRDKKAKKH